MIQYCNIVYHGNMSFFPGSLVLYTSLSSTLTVLIIMADFMSVENSFCCQACTMSGTTLCFLKPRLLILDFHPQGVYVVQKDRQAEPVSATSRGTSYDGALQSSSHMTFSRLVTGQLGQLCCGYRWEDEVSVRLSDWSKVMWLLSCKHGVWMQVFVSQVVGLSRSCINLVLGVNLFCFSVIFIRPYNICFIVYILLLVF